MADAKISALTALTTPSAADVLPIVETATSTTKKMTFANLVAGFFYQTIRGEAVSGSGTAFTLAHAPIANTLQLFRGGARITVAGGDYTIVSAAITLTVALETGNTLSADYSY